MKNKYHELENEFSIIKNKITQTSKIDEIKIPLESFVSNNIFHGLCETSILEKTQELNILEDNEHKESLNYIIEASNYLSNTIDDFQYYFSPDKSKIFNQST